LVETLRRVVRWAAEDGVREDSVMTTLSWEGVPSELQSQSQLSEADLLSSQELPSSSSTASYPDEVSSTPPDSIPVSPSESDEETAIETDADVDDAKPVKSLRPRDDVSRGASRNDGQSSAASSTITLVIPSSSRSKSRSVKLHLLSPLDLAPIVQAYAKSGTPPSQITLPTLDADIRARIGIKSDPELLIIHPLTPLDTFRSLLPRPAPELAGYPFWLLRITEIYQHPPPLPFLPLLSPLVRRLRQSSLPAMRKVGRSLPLVVRDPVMGAMSREEWDAGLEALSVVEQRLGK